MTTVLCTLYNSLYLDKGLVLYDSLCMCAKDFRLYVLCMDDKCYEVLTNMNQDYHIPIRLSDFEAGDKALLEAKDNRSFGEYCWTCTPSIILYILNTYNESICTYVDADMFFYNDPQMLIDEMIDSGRSVMIVPHRFTRMQRHLEMNGLFCVEFNTFLYNPAALKVLEQWRKDCLDCCTAVNDGIHFGDQKYLDTWPHEYPDIVYVCQNLGAGVAPWNIGWFVAGNLDNNEITYKESGKKVQVVFYHFQHITYISRNAIKTSILSHLKSIDYNLVDWFYKGYLIKIDSKKTMLDNKYAINTIMFNHPVENKIRQKGWKNVLKQFKITFIILRFIFPNKYNEEYKIFI